MSDDIRNFAETVFNAAAILFFVAFVLSLLLLPLELSNTRLVFGNGGLLLISVFIGRFIALTRRNEE